MLCIKYGAVETITKLQYLVNRVHTKFHVGSIFEHLNGVV